MTHPLSGLPRATNVAALLRGHNGLTGVIPSQPAISHPAPVADIVFDMPSRLRLSYSMIADWQACRHRWQWRYVDRFWPKVLSEPMDTGSAVHAALESFLRGQNPEEGLLYQRVRMLDRLPVLEDLEETPEESVDSIIDAARAIFQRIIQLFDFSAWETVVYQDTPLIEYEMEAPVPHFRSYVGKVDWVAREKSTGYAWLFEFKTRDTFHAESDEEVDLQKASYQCLLKYHNIPTVGSIALQMKRKPPKIPKVNKDGTVSRARVATDWQTYAAFVRSIGQDPADYAEEMQPKLDVPFYSIIRSLRGEQEVENVWNTIIVPVAEDIAREQRSIYRSMNKFTCQNCQYRVPCTAALRGYDVDYLLSTQYTRLTD